MDNRKPKYLDLLMDNRSTQDFSGPGLQDYEGLIFIHPKQDWEASVFFPHGQQNLESSFILW